MQLALVTVESEIYKMWNPQKLFHCAPQRGSVEFQQGQFLVVSYHGVQNVPVNIKNDSMGLLKWQQGIYAIKDCHCHNGVLWNMTVWHSETRSTVPHTTNITHEAIMEKLWINSLDYKYS